MASGLKFDFGQVNKKWRASIRRANAKAVRASARVDALNSNLDVSEEEIEAAWDALENAEAERDGLLGQVVKEVPKAWLIESAPAEIDWSELGAFDWVRPDKSQALSEGLAEAIQKPGGKS